MSQNLQNENSPFTHSTKNTALHSQHWTVLKETRKNNSPQEHHETLVYPTAHTALAHSVMLESLISNNPTSGNGQEPGKHPLRLTQFQFGIQFLFCIFLHTEEKNTLFGKYIMTHM